MYEKGTYFKKDINKSIEYYEKGCDLNNYECLVNLANLYKKGNEVPIDLEKSCSYLLRACFVSEDNVDFVKIQLLRIISTKKVEWRTEYHEFWGKQDLLDKQIVVLLLISKNRKESIKEESKVLVKGIIMKIIKFLCHFRQK